MITDRKQVISFLKENKIQIFLLNDPSELQRVIDCSKVGKSSLSTGGIENRIKLVVAYDSATGRYKLFAGEDIPRGTVLGTLAGEKITESQEKINGEQIDPRYIETFEDNKGNIDRIIYTRDKATLGSFIWGTPPKETYPRLTENKKNKPTSSIRLEETKDKRHIYKFTRVVKKGEEIFSDYEDKDNVVTSLAQIIVDNNKLLSRSDYRLTLTENYEISINPVKKSDDEIPDSKNFGKEEILFNRDKKEEIPDIKSFPKKPEVKNLEKKENVVQRLVISFPGKQKIEEKIEEKIETGNPPNKKRKKEYIFSTEEDEKIKTETEKLDEKISEKKQKIKELDAAIKGKREEIKILEQEYSERNDDLRKLTVIANERAADARILRESMEEQRKTIERNKAIIKPQEEKIKKNKNFSIQQGGKTEQDEDVSVITTNNAVIKSQKETINKNKSIIEQQEKQIVQNKNMLLLHYHSSMANKNPIESPKEKINSSVVKPFQPNPDLNPYSNFENSLTFFTALQEFSKDQISSTTHKDKIEFLIDPKVNEDDSIDNILKLFAEMETLGSQGLEITYEADLEILQKQHDVLLKNLNKIQIDINEKSAILERRIVLNTSADSIQETKEEIEALRQKYQQIETVSNTINQQLESKRIPTIPTMP